MLVGQTLTDGRWAFVLQFEQRVLNEQASQIFRAFECQPGIWVSACQHAITNCVHIYPGYAHQNDPKSDFLEHREVTHVVDFFSFGRYADKELLLCSFVDPSESIKGQIGIINAADPGRGGRVC